MRIMTKIASWPKKLPILFVLTPHVLDFILMIKPIIMGIKVTEIVKKIFLAGISILEELPYKLKRDGVMIKANNEVIVVRAKLKLTFPLEKYVNIFEVVPPGQQAINKSVKPILLGRDKALLKLIAQSGINKY